MKNKIFYIYSIKLLLIYSLLISCKNDQEDIKTDVILDESLEISKLYNQAIINKEDSLIVWAGGDVPTNPNHWIVSQWNKDFPEIKIKLVTDLSKFHNLRINEELQNQNFVTPDVSHLQTVDDFHRWKKENILENYFPLNWDKIPMNIKDPEGAFTPVFMITFAHFINTSRLNESQYPNSFMDYLKPEFKNNLILTYPHDDDAVLYLFKKITDKYGLNFIDQLIAQNPEWIRGTAAPRSVVAKAEKMATFGVAGAFISSNNGKVILPKEDFFLTWAQTGAIFKKSRHKNAAKLYMSWILSKKMQEQWIQWSVRTDIQPKSGYLHYTNYSNNSPVDFSNFMINRIELDVYKQIVEEKIGPVEGASPLTDPRILERL